MEMQTDDDNVKESHFGPKIEDSIKDEHYRLCLTALQRATNDTEKLISLLIITRYLKPGKLSRDQLLSLFDQIGNEFLQRLLLIPETEPNSSTDISSTCMQSISVNILHSILAVKPDHLPLSVLVKMFTQISIILKSIDSNCEEGKFLLGDIISCFHALVEMSPDKQNLATILKSSGAIEPLVTILISKVHMTHELYMILYRVFCDPDISVHVPEFFTRFIYFTASEFKSNQSQQKFEICSQLANIIQQNSIFLSQFQSLNPSTSSASPPIVSHDPSYWLPLITEGLYDILSSRLDKQRRDPAFYLIVALNKAFPLFVWMTYGTNNSLDESRCKNFLPLVLRLVCIEICLELRKEESIDDQLLNACFILFESLINTICAEPGSLEFSLKLTPNDIVNLYNSLRETILTVIDFIKTVLHDWEHISTNQTTFTIVMGCIRIICFWTLEDLSGIDEKIIDLVPFLVQLLHDQKSFNIVGHFILTSFYEICVNCDDSDPLKRSILSYDIQSDVSHFQSISPFNDQMDKICEAFRNLK